MDLVQASADCLLVTNTPDSQYAPQMPVVLCLIGDSGQSRECVLGELPRCPWFILSQINSKPLIYVGGEDDGGFERGSLRTFSVEVDHHLGRLRRVFVQQVSCRSWPGPYIWSARIHLCRLQ